MTSYEMEKAVKNLDYDKIEEYELNTQYEIIIKRINHETYYRSDLSKAKGIIKTYESLPEHDQDIIEQNKINKIKKFISEYNEELAISNEENFFKQPLKKNVKTQPEITAEEQQEINTKLKDPQLIKHIWKLLDKYHKEDHLEKLAVFIIALSGELPEQDRCSTALKGNSSAGKDNAIKTAFLMFPETDSFLLTRGTQSALEEETAKIKRIAFSEMNKNREGGANKELTEFFKQLSEGGVNVIKRDPKDKKTIQNIKTEQKTLLYGTTETQSDEELETRYVIIPIRSNEQKNYVVVNDYLQTVSDPEKYYDKIKKTNWLQKAIKRLRSNIDILVPYAKYLSAEFEYEEQQRRLFDLRKERVKRDVKRIISLTKAITWIYQKQRETKTYLDKEYLISKPQDFKLAYAIFSEFFEQTYIGIDHRILNTYKKIKELEGQQTKELQEAGFGFEYLNWVFRHKVQEELGINSVNTIKGYVKELKDKGLVEVHYNESIPKGYLLKTETGYQSGYQQTIRAYYLKAIDTLLTPYFDTLKINEFDVYLKIKQEYDEFNTFLTIFLRKLTPSKLTPSNQHKYIHNSSSKKTSGYLVEEVDFDDSYIDKSA